MRLRRGSKSQRVALSRSDLGLRNQSARGRQSAAAAAAAAFGGSRALRERWPGLGRCTRMHKRLEPRSMSETGHLPTDVESSGRESLTPRALPSRPGPCPPPVSSLPPRLHYISFLVHLYLPSCLALSLLLAPDASEPSSKPTYLPSLHQDTFVRRSRPYANHLPLGPPSDRRAFYRRKKQCVFRG